MVVIHDAVESSTVTANDALPTWPEMSAALQAAVVAPSGTTAPDSGALLPGTE